VAKKSDATLGLITADEVGLGSSSGTDPARLVVAPEPFTEKFLFHAQRNLWQLDDVLNPPYLVLPISWDDLGSYCA